MNAFGIARNALVTAVLLALSIGGAQTYEDLVNPPPEDWPQLGRNIVHHSYSPLEQITPENVQDLSLVWARDLGFAPQGFPTNIQGTPSVWNGTMYVSTETGVVALDGATGETICEYSRPYEGDVMHDAARRGAPLVFEGNVFVALRYGMTVAVDAETCEEVWSVQLTDSERNEGFTTEPIIADGKLLVGVSGADFAGAPGKISAIDVENGEVLWTFNTVPLSPDDPAYDTWNNPPSWEAGIGGASPWNTGTYDPETGLVVWGTGQPTPWDRITERRADEGEPTADLYSASFVALDVETGELQWYHQVVPADEWDYDQQTLPTFADLEIDGETRRVAILATTTGYLVLIDAETGEFIDAYQGHPEPTVHLGYEEDGTSIINPDARFTEAGQFFRVCPGLRWAQYTPPAYNPETGLYFRPNNHNCMNFAPQALPDDWEPGDRAYFYETGPKNEDYYFDRVGGITAFDPATGEVAWDWGHYYTHDAAPVVTGGGLLFTAAQDSRVRALDASTGEVLWQQAVTAASNGGTITYSVDGRQYVASLVGWGSGAEADHPDADVPPVVPGNAAVFVFALPESE